MKIISCNKMAAMIVVLVLGALVIGTQSSSALSDNETIEKAVLETNERMTQAGNNLDSEKFFSFILDSEKGPIIQNGRLFRSRAEALEIIKAGFRATAKIDRKYDHTYVTVLAPDAALLTGTGDYTATLSDGRTVTGPFAVSLFFVLRNGQWKVLHGHYSTPNQ